MFADIYSAYSCLGNTMVLNCTNETSIFVKSAIYGQFQQICNQDGIACCPSNPAADCTEDLETNSPQDWAALKLICDNQSSCEFINQGGYVASCAQPTVVDYMTVLYQCLPGQ